MNRTVARQFAYCAQLMYEMFSPTTYALGSNKSKMLQYTIDTFGGRSTCMIRLYYDTDLLRQFWIACVAPI
jgi:hypothetical protein